MERANIVISIEPINTKYVQDAGDAIVVYGKYKSGFISVIGQHRLSDYGDEFDKFESALEFLIETLDDCLKKGITKDSIFYETDRESHYDYETHTSWDTVDNDLYIEDERFNINWDDLFGQSISNSTFEELFDFIKENKLLFNFDKHNITFENNRNY